MSRSSAGVCSSSLATSSAFSRTFVAATCVADPVMTVAREACAPMPCAIRSVRPWMTLMRLVVDAERFGANLRHRGLEALPQRRAAGDQFDRAGRIDGRPVRRRRGRARSSRRTWPGRRRPLRPSARRRSQLVLQLVPVERAERLVEQPRRNRRNRRRSSRPACRSAARTAFRSLAIRLRGAPRSDRARAVARSHPSCRSRTNVLS